MNHSVRIINSGAYGIRFSSLESKWTGQSERQGKKTSLRGFKPNLTKRTHRLCSVTISGLRGSRNILGSDKIPPDGKPTVTKKIQRNIFKNWLNNIKNIGLLSDIWRGKWNHHTLQSYEAGPDWNLLSRWRLVMPFSVSVASMVEMEEGKM